MKISTHMKSKLLVIAVSIFILLPVMYVAIKELSYKGKQPKKIDVAAATGPEQFKYTITVPDTAHQYLLLSPFKLYNWKHGNLRIMDLQGNIYVDRYIKGLVNGFKQVRLQEKTYYFYMVNDSASYHIKKIGLNAGHGVLLDSMLHPIKEYHLLAHQDIVPDKGQDLDLHDLILFSPDHYIAIAAYEKKPKNIPDSLHYNPKVNVVANILQEVKDGKVIWQWDATHYPELYTTSIEHNEWGDTTKSQDYAHINALFLDPRDNNLIASFRCLDQTIKINRKTGAIMWRLGGKTSDFNIPEHFRPMRQHAAHFASDGKTLVMLDNGHKTQRKYTRILSFTLDEKSHTIIDMSELPLPDRFAEFMGNATVVGDDYFISGGTGNYIQKRNKLTGKLLFEMTTNQPNYRVYTTDNIYGLEKERGRK